MSASVPRSRGVVRWPFAAPAVLIAVVFVLLALQMRAGEEARATLARVPVKPTPQAEVMLGTTTLPLARNSWRRWTVEDLRSLDATENAVGKHMSVVMWFADWFSVRGPDLTQLRAVAARGSIPEITWEPWDSRKPLRTPQPRFRLRNIIEGRFDAHVRRWARDLAAYGETVRLRFAHEMNGNWYPWSETANGNAPGEFAEAWRHVWNIFQEEGADNVEWVWSPVALQIKDGEYPGDEYVDRLGLSGFVGGVQLRHKPFRSFGEVFGAALERFSEIAPDLPIEISELGVAEEGGDKAEFIRDMFEQIDATPAIDAVVWFGIRKESDWRIETSPASVDAFRVATASPRYGQRHRRYAGLAALPGPGAPPRCC